MVLVDDLRLYFYFGENLWKITYVVSFFTNYNTFILETIITETIMENSKNQDLKTYIDVIGWHNELEKVLTKLNSKPAT